MQKIWNARFFSALTVLSALLVKTSESRAWAGLEGPPFPLWRKVPVPYYVNKATLPPLVTGNAEDRVTSGFDAWSAPECTFFDTLPMGDLPDATFDINDGKNVILWINKPNSWPTELGPEDGVIGVTLPVWGKDSLGRLALEDADIIFNNVGFCWFDYEPMNPGQTCSGGKPADILSIVTHEQGHFLGLGHTTVAGATMEPAYLGGNSLATIEQDDIDGVCALYPIGGQMSSSGASGVSCDVCRQNAEQIECSESAKKCSTSCEKLGDCLLNCPRNDIEGYEACATLCSAQFKDGLQAYTALTNCVCNVCAEPCAAQCAGPSESGAGGAPCGTANGNGGRGGVCPDATFTGMGGCGCNVADDEARWASLAMAGVVVLLSFRRRRRVTG